MPPACRKRLPTTDPPIDLTPTPPQSIKVLPRTIAPGSLSRSRGECRFVSVRGEANLILWVLWIGRSFQTRAVGRLRVVYLGLIRRLHLRKLRDLVLRPDRSHDDRGLLADNTTGAAALGFYDRAVREGAQGNATGNSTQLNSAQHSSNCPSVNGGPPISQPPDVRLTYGKPVSLRQL